MFDMWLKVSYMVQLIGACLLFMLPLRKKKRFGIRMGVASAILILTSYAVNVIDVGQLYGAWFFLYWGLYILICVLFVWIGMDGTWLEAVYYAICACAMQHVAFDVYLILQIVTGEKTLLSVLAYIGIYLLFYFFFAKKMTQQEGFFVNRTALFPIATIILLVWILSVLDGYKIAGVEADGSRTIIYRITDALCCFYILWVQVSQREKMRLQRELDGINYAWRQQTSQYHVTKETIEIINRKCHDLKHQIRAFRQMTDEQEKEEYLTELEHAIMIYDTALKTKNQALDTVLMEKGLFCKDHGIQWSCMADGSKLDFMKLEDIYAIFGNALDNAITAVLDLEDIEKRVISVKVITRKSLLMIQIQNYYDKDLQFEEGVPVTTKKNKRDHGYGMKSIRYTAEKYNGTITVKAENHIFMLQILIPVQE